MISMLMVHYLLQLYIGGYDAFSAEFPHLCVRAQQRNAPLGISVSTSLPIRGFGCYQSKVASQRPLLTPSEDDGTKFGPPVEVLPFLVLGCAKDSADLTQLRKMGITAILNVSHNCPNHFETLFEYKCIPVQDSHQADLLSVLQTAFDFISKWKHFRRCVLTHHQQRCHSHSYHGIVVSFNDIACLHNFIQFTPLYTSWLHRFH